MKLALLMLSICSLRAQVISIDCGSPTDTAFLGGTAYTDATIGGPRSTPCALDRASPTASLHHRGSIWSSCPL